MFGQVVRMARLGRMACLSCAKVVCFWDVGEVNIRVSNSLKALRRLLKKVCRLRKGTGLQCFLAYSACFAVANVVHISCEE